MDTEFATLIRTIAESEPRPEKRSIRHGVIRSLRDLVSTAVDAFNRVGPYGCELRPFTKLRIARAERRKRREAIGHHGLA